MIKAKYNGWRVLYNGQSTVFEYIDNLINLSELVIVDELKNDRRSLVLLVVCNGRKVVLKVPVEKNTRKWIRFTTLYRRGEAFKFLLNLEKIQAMGIPTCKPLMAVEKRRFGMVVDSRILYEYAEGGLCGPDQYPAVIETLKQFHQRNRLHGDAQLVNFICNDGKIRTIDSCPRRPWFGGISRAYEFVYLEKSAPEIGACFDFPTDTWSFRMARKFSRVLQSWRRFKRKARGQSAQTQ